MASEGGFRVYSSAGVGAGSAPTLPYKIASAESTDIFEGDLVKMVDDGSVVAMSAVTNVAIVGVFVGCEYTNADGQRVWSNKYTSTITQDDSVAFVNVNPHQIYKVKCADSDVDTTITRTEVGLRFDVEFNAGNATTGMSGQVLDTGTSGATTVANIKVVGVINEDGTDGAKGAVGATFTHALVIIDPDISIFGSSAGI
jgi:hypothetical protein